MTKLEYDIYISTFNDIYMSELVMSEESFTLWFEPDQHIV
jgi:hypothetical protein